MNKSSGLSASEQTLHEQAEKAKKKLIDDLNKMTVMEETGEEGHIHEEMDDPRVKRFAVSNPVKINGHIKYTISGEDSDGVFEEVRRFREFYALRNALVQRWPGIYIPSIPEKSLVVTNFIV